MTYVIGEVMLRSVGKLPRLISMQLVWDYFDLSEVYILYTNQTCTLQAANNLHWKRKFCPKHEYEGGCRITILPPSLHTR